IKKFGYFDEKNFYKSNYSAIRVSKCESLIKYVENNVNEYIDSVYLKIDINKDEPYNYLLDLLNHTEIEKSDQERILLWTNTLIKDISELNSIKDLIDFLLENNKIEINWNNIFHAYSIKDYEFSDT